MGEYRGRLELTWTNKSERLLAHEDGSYEWLPPADFRIAEVRLLHDISTVGEVASDAHRAQDNLLIRGDALNALTSLATLPEFEREYAGKVKLAYLDPPFNTQQSFLQYDDALEHSVWLTMMRDRLAQVKTLLSPDGSVWVHCDDSEQAYLKVMMDELFGRENFVATVLWQKVYMPKNSARHFSADHDYMLVYALNADVWRPNEMERTEAMNARYNNPDSDSRGPWKPGDLSARNYYSLGRYPINTPSGRIVPGPPQGRYWVVSADKLAALDADNRIWWGPERDGMPALKRFLSEVRGRVPQTMWFYDEVGRTQEAKKEVLSFCSPDSEPFATPKPERLIKRIVEIGSGCGDIVLA